VLYGADWKRIYLPSDSLALLLGWMLLQVLCFYPVRFLMSYLGSFRLSARYGPRVNSWTATLKAHSTSVFKDCLTLGRASKW
jgi:hypothetical protein